MKQIIQLKRAYDRKRKPMAFVYTLTVFGREGFHMRRSITTCGIKKYPRRPNCVNGFTRILMAYGHNL